MSHSMRTLVLPLSCIGVLACTSPAVRPPADPTAIQAAAILFLVHANTDQAPCVQVAVGPNEMTSGRVTKQLQDPPGQLVNELKRQGVAVRPFSSCSLAERRKVTYAIGWPRATARGVQINADRLCGFRCGEGSLLHVKDVGTEWRATEAETTWIT